MRILLIHNYYQQAGGEDAVFTQEVALLREQGFPVETLTFTNESFDGSFWGNLRSAGMALYNTESARRLEEVIGRFRPDVVHLHNLFYTASASVIRVAKQHGLPVVMTLHNYRLVCVSGLLMRAGKVPCETCLTQTVALSGIRHACFRDSYLQSTQLSLTTLLHKLTGIWRSVDRFVVMTDFARQKFLASSLRPTPEQIMVKPNFVPDTGFADSANRKDFYLYAGRLSPEKGIDVLLKAAQTGGFPLRIIGDGPLVSEVKQAVANCSTISFLGWQNREAVTKLLKTCRAVLIPSVCYEGLPTVMLEAFATGTPIVCSDGENLRNLVGNAGLHFITDDADDLSLAIQVLDLNLDLRLKLAQKSRQQYRHYTKSVAMNATLKLYEEVTGLGMVKNPA
jgi:glycosyltransferase involved in cell wall biosynthesis